MSFSRASDKRLPEPAQRRLAELREEFLLRKANGDRERISQIKFMAETIKAGETTFIYELPKR